MKDRSSQRQSESNPKSTKGAGRPPGSKNLNPPKPKETGPRVYTQEQKERKAAQRQAQRLARKEMEKKVKSAVNSAVNSGTTQVFSAAVVVPNVPTDEKVAYLESSFGCSSEIRNHMSSGSITTVYVAARVFESVHIKAGRKKSSMIRKFSDFLKSQ